MKMIITVANFTDGWGKSTTCINLGHALALSGERCLLVDGDPKSQLATMLGLRQESCITDWLWNARKGPQSVRETGRKNLWLIPGDKEAWEEIKPIKERRLQQDFFLPQQNSFLDDFDYCIIDTSLSAFYLEYVALLGSSLVLIPYNVEYSPIVGTYEMIDTVTNIKKFRPDASWMLPCILPTFIDMKKAEIYQDLEDIFGTSSIGYKFGIYNVFHGVLISFAISGNVGIGKTVFECDPNGHGANDYEILRKQIMDIPYTGI